MYTDQYLILIFSLFWFYSDPDSVNADTGEYDNMTQSVSLEFSTNNKMASIEDVKESDNNVKAVARGNDAITSPCPNPNPTIATLASTVKVRRGGRGIREIYNHSRQYNAYIHAKNETTVILLGVLSRSGWQRREESSLGGTSCSTADLPSST